MENLTCPVCAGGAGGTCTLYDGNPPLAECTICGRYTMASYLYSEIRANRSAPSPWDLNPIQRAALSHRVRVKSDIAKSATQYVHITWSVLADLREGAELPSLAAQAANAIRFIGDHVSRSGSALAEPPPEFHAIVGSPDPASAEWLLIQLRDKGIIDIGSESLESRPLPGRQAVGLTTVLKTLRLTLDGSERYQTEKRAGASNDYGFIAMQFNEPTLDSFVRDAVKPTIRKTLGYDLVDMRDVSRAGVIDNIMRMQIRGAAFVIVDLTHGNEGAYWEAGYAEGLGKPVVYICEKGVFEENGTHFDTNHCTTVVWSTDDHEAFCDSLIATLRRSLAFGS